LDGNGIIKPDVLTYGTNVMVLSSEDYQTCTSSSGTSISSSIITAATALALSQFDDLEYRKDLKNTAFIKEALVNSADPLPNLSITEQGAGIFNLDKFMSKVLE